jgi:serine/threonine protein kinase
MTQHVGELKYFCPDCGRAWEEAAESCPEDGTPLQAYRLADAGGTSLVGEVLDERFRIDGELGEGGMGRVYRSVQLSIDRDVALKVLHSDLSGDENVVRRFFQEARLISECSHPNIVRVVDFGQDSTRGSLYLAMEMVDGVDLRDLLAEGRLAPELALEMIRQTCSALSEIHNRGIVHRDLKPENLMATIMSDRSVRIKVVDFGIAHALQANQQTRLTEKGMVYGTPAYMAPEQAEGQKVGPTADVYALGAIFFELLTGQVLFEAANPMETRFRHIRSEPPELDDILPAEERHDSLNELLNSMLRKDPGSRPDDALAVRDEIEAIQRERGFSSPLRIDSDDSHETHFDPWIETRLARTWGEQSDDEPTNDSSETHDRGTSTILSEARHTGAREIPPTQGFGAGDVPAELMGDEGLAPKVFEGDGASIGDERSAPTVLEESSGGSLAEGSSAPTVVEEAAESSLAEGSSAPTRVEPSQSIDDDDSAPAAVDTDARNTAETVQQTPPGFDLDGATDSMERRRETPEPDETRSASSRRLGLAVLLVGGVGLGLGALLFGMRSSGGDETPTASSNESARSHVSTDASVGRVERNKSDGRRESNARDERGEATVRGAGRSSTDTSEPYDERGLSSDTGIRGSSDASVPSTRTDVDGGPSSETEADAETEGEPTSEPPTSDDSSDHRLEVFPVE